MPNEEYLVIAKEIGKSFSAVRAVDGISFKIKRGSIFALLGPNGAGKSTLVRMLIGMLPPDQGMFEWRDVHGNVTARDRSKIGYLPEDRGLYKDQCVQAILEYFAALRGMNTSQSRSAAARWMERLGIQQHAKNKLEILSKGNQQKVQVASAILHQPELAVLDEPFSGLDPINQELMMDLMHELQAAGTTILLSAHQLNLVERLADHVMVIARGREILSGSVDAICQGTFGGKTLHVEFEGRIERQITETLASLPGVRELIDEKSNAITLRLDTGQNLPVWLERLNQMGEIHSFSIGDTSLHDIYLRSIRVEESQRKLVEVYA